MTEWVANSYLASCVIIPLILLGGGFGLGSLLAVVGWPTGRMLQVFTVFVFALQMVAAIAWLGWHARVFGETSPMWAVFAFLVLVWVRTLHLIRSERGSSVPPASPSADRAASP